jgi:hypothetical protein
MWEEIKMTDIIKLTSLLDDKVKEYEIVQEIGKGTTGIAYGVKDKAGDGTIYAAKECITDAKIDFLSDAEQIYRNRPLHFVQIVNYGNAEIIIASAEENGKNAAHENPVSIMEYGGSNLRTVVEFLQKYKNESGEYIGPLQGRQNAIKAFEYKVLYTLLEGIGALHKQKKQGWHGDLVSTNILCGFDLSEVKNGNEINVSLLEEKLIYGSIRLCDSSPSGKVGSMSLSNFRDLNELSSRDKILYLHLLSGGTDFQKQDINALVGYLWWFLGGKTRSPSYFTEVVKSYDDNGELVASISDILAGIDNKFNTNKALLKQRLVVNQDNSLLILRTVDAFRNEFAPKMPLSTSADFNSMYKDAEHSYEKMYQNGSRVMHADEEKAMQDSLKEFVLVSTIEVYYKAQQKNKESIGPSTEKDKLVKELSKLRKQKEHISTGLNMAKSKAKIAASTSGDNLDDDDLFNAYQSARDSFKLHSTQLNNVQTEITTNDTRKKNIESILIQYNCDEELKTLAMASKNCPSEVYVGRFQEIVDYFIKTHQLKWSNAEVRTRCNEIITTTSLWDKVVKLLPS